MKASSRPKSVLSHFHMNRGTVTTTVRNAGPRRLRKASKCKALVFLKVWPMKGIEAPSRHVKLGRLTGKVIATASIDKL
jgi:hypothetical protein